MRRSQMQDGVLKQSQRHMLVPEMWALKEAEGGGLQVLKSEQC